VIELHVKALLYKLCLVSPLMQCGVAKYGIHKFNFRFVVLTKHNALDTYQGLNIPGLWMSIIRTQDDTAMIYNNQFYNIAH